MPKKDEELLESKVEKQQSESLENSKKIDLYINNSDKDEPKGISIMNVFSRLKQRFHIYVWVMLIGLFAGLLAPTLMYTFKNKQESAVAVLGLDYGGADAGLAPDGSGLDITYLKSSYIVENALKSVTLSKEVSWKENYDQPRQHIKKQRHYFADKGPSREGYGFSSSRVWM